VQVDRSVSCSFSFFAANQSKDKAASEEVQTGKRLPNRSIAYTYIADLTSLCVYDSPWTLFCYRHVHIRKQFAL